MGRIHISFPEPSLPPQSEPQPLSLATSLAEQAALSPDPAADDEQVKARESAALDLWIARFEGEWRRNSAKGGALFSLVALPASLVAESSPVVSIARWLLMIIGLENLLFLAISRRLSAKMLNKVGVGHIFVVISSILVSCFVALQTPSISASAPSAGRTIIVFLAFLVGAQLISSLFGSFSILSLIAFAVHIALGIALWQAVHLDRLGIWVLVLVALDAYFFAVNVASFEGLKQQGRSAIKTQTLRLKNKRLRLQALESELRLARRLKESCSPTAETIYVGRFAITCSYHPTATIGGDWVGVLKLPNDSAILAVATIDGSGIPAAMVVQSLQALWVSIKPETFDATAWLNLVNATMVRMGRITPHRLSLNLVVIQDNALTLYSAGHGPVSLLENTQDPGSHRLITSNGSLIGVNAELGMSPLRLELSKQTELALILTASRSDVVSPALSGDQTLITGGGNSIGTSIIVRGYPQQQHLPLRTAV